MVGRDPGHELEGVLTAGHCWQGCRVIFFHTAAAARDAAARDEAAAVRDEAAAAGDEAAVRDYAAPGRRDALGSWSAPPSRSELRWRVCARHQGGVRGVGIEGRHWATCWLHPKPYMDFLQLMRLA
ncbi:unnamed protein product [Boreogadus saida]